MSLTFCPANSFTAQRGIFVALVGGPNSGKTYSAMRLARGIAGPNGRIAVLDTEGGRVLNLREAFKFDAMLMSPPHRPERYASAASHAEAQKFDVLVIDSFTAEWRGVGGVLDWIEEELDRLCGSDDAKRERQKARARVRPKVSHKLMVSSFLDRRIPIVFSVRGEDSFDPNTNKAVFKPMVAPGFLFEVTVSFRLSSDRRGFIDLGDPQKYKLEGAHRSIFRDGEQLCEEHGRALAEWARGGQPAQPTQQQDVGTSGVPTAADYIEQWANIIAGASNADQLAATWNGQKELREKIDWPEDGTFKALKDKVGRAIEFLKVPAFTPALTPQEQK